MIKKGKWYFEHFDSISETLNTIKERPTSKVWDGKRKSSEVGDPDFSKSRDYEDGERIILFGDPETVEAIKKDIRKIEITGTQIKSKQVNQMVGHTPIVPNLLQGIPINMVSTERAVVKAKTVTVVWNMTISCGTRAEEIQKCGIALLGAIYRLELNGVRVRLVAMGYCGEENNECVGFTTEIKGYREKLDITRVSGPMTHPAFFRRIGFKYLENHPEITQPYWPGGYGTSIVSAEGRTAPYFKWVMSECYKDGVHLTLNEIQADNYDTEVIAKRIQKEVSEITKEKIKKGVVA